MPQADKDDQKKTPAPAGRKRPAPTKTSPFPAPVVSAGDSAAARADKQVAALAYQKVMKGEELSRREREALKRFERDKEERLRWQYYGSIPQKHWRTMSGRQTKVLNEQATRYGIPFGGATINLPAVVLALHDFLAANAHKLSKDDDEDPLMRGGSGSPALERYREERTLLARYDRLERERVLVPREQVRSSLGQIAAILRSAGDTLGRQFGSGATDLLYEALNDAVREIERSFGEEASPPSIPTGEPTDGELTDGADLPDANGANGEEALPGP